MADTKVPVAMPNHKNETLIFEVRVCIFLLYNLGECLRWITNHTARVYLPMADPGIPHSCDPKPA